MQILDPIPELNLQTAQNPMWVQRTAGDEVLFIASFGLDSDPARRSEGVRWSASTQQWSALPPLDSGDWGRGREMGVHGRFIALLLHHCRRVLCSGGSLHRLWSRLQSLFQRQRPGFGGQVCFTPVPSWPYRLNFLAPQGNLPAPSG